MAGNLQKDMKGAMSSISTTCQRLGLVLAACIVSACASSSSWLPAAGPSTREVEQTTDSRGVTGIQIVDVTNDVARSLLANRKLDLFSDTFAEGAAPAYVVGAGDVLEVSVWEAPPAALFGVGMLDARSGPATTRVTAFPEQMVGSDGTINMPFAGQIPAVGRSLQEIETEIVQRLKGKANQPQVLVRLVRNVSANVTVVGEVASSTRMPLTPRGERLLDALAAAGGVRQPVSKMTLQLTRGDRVRALPLDTIIRDPRQNIALQPGDVVTAMHQPLSFTMLGATGKNEEVNFEAQGISLAQALARSGGLHDARADAQGVFIFRFEQADALDWRGQAVKTPDGKVPVVYRVNLNDPATFFVAQNFPVSNKDVIFVTNAPAAELQKFLNLVISAIYPVASVVNLNN